MPCNNNIEPIKAKIPSIAIYGIYKNEQKFIERFLESVQKADEVVLCDTGATDNTNNIIKKFIESHQNINLKTVPIGISPWRFDDARNTALSLVSPCVEICISLDIDEYLMGNWKEHLVSQWEDGITRYYHKFKTFWTDGSVSENWHERIHSRNGYTWKLPVHEILEYNGLENIKRLPNFWIYQNPEEKDSRNSYLSLLEQSVKERKDIWKSWSFLAGEYLNVARYDDALKAIDTALEISNSDKSFLHKQKHFVYKAQRNIDLALLSLNTSIFYMPERREVYLEKARYLSELGRNIEAYFTVIEAEKRTDRIIDYHYSFSAWDRAFYDLKIKIYRLAKKEGLII
jgi:glycosyltransferase involved in cell wall biosynthesis